MPLALSPDERWFAPRGARRHDPATGRPDGRRIRTIRGLDGAVRVLAFSPDGSRLLGADEGGVLKIWDIATGRELAATTLSGVWIRSPGSARTGSGWPSGASRTVADR